MAESLAPTEVPWLATFLLPPRTPPSLMHALAW